MTDRGRDHDSLEASLAQWTSGESIGDCIDRLGAAIAEMRAERVRIAAILETFRQAPLSVASVQPLLELAEALNGPLVTT